MPVVSVDLAYKRYGDVGVALLDYAKGQIRCVFQPINLGGEPNANDIAEYLTELCGAQGAAILVIDGPQGWKHPENGLIHSRLCERTLNTPAKTGLPETVKPANYAPFVRFSVKVFNRLVQLGWHLLGEAVYKSDASTLIESFPLSAWRSLGISPLPAKSKAEPADIEDRRAELQKRFPLTCSGRPSHDDLQALVSGLAGIAIEFGLEGCFSMTGKSPVLFEETWREGFIVNPVARTDWRALLP